MSISLCHTWPNKVLTWYLTAWTKSFIFKKKKKDTWQRFIGTLNNNYLKGPNCPHTFCGGVKPRPMIWAQEQRFINSTPEEKKS